MSCVARRRWLPDEDRTGKETRWHSTSPWRFLARQSSFVTRHIHHTGAPERIVSDPEACHPAVSDFDCCGSPLPRRSCPHRAPAAVRPALRRRNAMTFPACAVARRRDTLLGAGQERLAGGHDSRSPSRAQAARRGAQGPQNLLCGAASAAGRERRIGSRMQNLPLKKEIR